MTDGTGGSHSQISVILYKSGKQMDITGLFISPFAATNTDVRGRERLGGIISLRHFTLITIGAILPFHID